jgi:hypothetical protein
MKKKLLALSVMAAISTQAHAFQIETSDDWEVRWDNTFKFNVMSRVAEQDKDVYEGGRGNSATAAGLADDATLSVDRSGLGIVSTRLDVFSELDVIWKNDFGLRISASGWYDHAYKDSDHPNTRATWATPSVKPGEYGEDAEDLHYLGGELLDAFVFANWDIGETALGVRAGRHTIYWGNSLLSTGAIAGIGGAMAPLDFSKALAVPGSEAKELFMPTGKLSAVWQLTDNLTLNAYYGFEHQRYRLPETGTYFSPAEGLTEDTEFATLIRGEEQRFGVEVRSDETSDEEYGFNVQYYIDAWNLETSFIYINYTDKNLHGLHAGQDLGPLGRVIAGSDSDLAPSVGGLMALWDLQCALGVWDCPNSPVPYDNDPSNGAIVTGNARWLFKEDIDLFGLSFAKEIAGVSVGADIVLRQDTGLAPDLATNLGAVYNSPDDSITALVEAGLGALHVEGDYNSYDSDNYRGPVGDVWSVVINGIGFLQDNGFWEGGSWIAEVTFQMLDDCTSDCEFLDYRVYEDRVVSTIGGVFKPTWYQVRPGWDLSVPMSISYTIDGEKSPFTFGGDEERGSGSIGVELLIDQAWTFNARYNAFFGPVAAGIGGLLKDRDNISLTLKRTF